MREIKFRAWDEDHYVFFNDAPEEYRWIIDEYGLTIEYFDADQCKMMGGELYEFGGWIACPNAIFEQFTGIRDNSGVDIYEGDIVEIEDMPASPDTVEYISSIVYSHGSFIVQCDVPVPLCAFKYKWSNGYSPMKLRVIGNIHQNPELLK